MIMQLNNAITDYDCCCLTEIYRRHQQLSDEIDYSGHSVLHWFHLQRAEGASETLSRIVRGCVQKMGDYGSPIGPLYMETIFLTALGRGGWHPRHADNCSQDEFGNWRPNHTPNRHLSAICYLNSDFEGGEIVFELQDLVIKPIRGLLLAFPSDQHHIHEVWPVKIGFRYTMAMWFTKNADCALSEFRSTIIPSQRI
jgi:hypothetical protein